MDVVAEEGVPVLRVVPQKSAQQAAAEGNAERGTPAPAAGLGRLGRVVEDNDAGLLDLLNAYGVTLRYNTRFEAMEAWSKPNGMPDHNARQLTWPRWRTVTQEALASFKMLVEKVGRVEKPRGPAPWKPSMERLAVMLDALSYDRTMRFDPFLVWLDGLPEWDGVERVERLLVWGLGAPEDELSAWAGRYMIAGAVGAATEKSGAAHEMPILMGRQGIGKSSLLSALLPDDSWLRTLRFGNDNQRMLEGIMGAVFVEWDEMDGVRRADVTHIKSFVSSEKWSYRRPYARKPSEVRRRWVLIATTNNDNAVPYDATGTRRFVPIACAATPYDVDEARLKVVSLREQIWAEGIARRGEDGWGGLVRLPAALRDHAADRGEEHRQRDESLELALQGLTEPGALADIARRIGLIEQDQQVVDRRDEMRLADGLKVLKWTSRRVQVEKKRQVIWSPPGEPDEDA